MTLTQQTDALAREFDGAIIEIVSPEKDECPWCGEPGTDGDFCDGHCRRAYWLDVRASG